VQQQLPEETEYKHENTWITWLKNNRLSGKHKSGAVVYVYLFME